MMETNGGWDGEETEDGEASELAWSRKLMSGSKDGSRPHQVRQTGCLANALHSRSQTGPKNKS